MSIHALSHVFESGAGRAAGGRAGGSTLRISMGLGRRYVPLRVDTRSVMEHGVQ